MAYTAPVQQDISIERNGETFEGSYHTEAGELFVSSRFGEKSTRLTGSAGYPRPLAQLLLAELVREAKLRSS